MNTIWHITSITHVKRLMWLVASRQLQMHAKLNQVFTPKSSNVNRDDTANFLRRPLVAQMGIARIEVV